MEKIKEVFSDKSIKPKEKIETLSRYLQDGTINIDDLLYYAKTSKDPVKASCIETIEYTTQNNPGFATAEWFDFVVDSLSEKSPRVKWESAKVILNCISQFKNKIGEALPKLLENTTNEGVVVRWSAAGAISEIYKIDEKSQAELLPIIEELVLKEEKNSIKKIYLSAIKKSKKA